MHVHKTQVQWLLKIIEDYQEKALFLPEHQKIRGDVWPDKKKQEWWEKIESTYQLSRKGEGRHNVPQLSGLITTYQLADDPKGILYLNDGANRTIHSILAYISHCKNTNKDYETTLKNVQITEQQLIYNNKEEAIQDYIDLNSKGTVATPYEILACKFISGLDDYATIWEPIFKQMHEIIDTNLLVIGYKGKGKREKAHKIKRDNLAMVARFASKDTSRWSPNVTTPLIDFNNKNHTSAEDKLLQICKELGAYKMKQVLVEMDRFLQDKIAYYRAVQHEFGRHNEVNTLTTIRWWLTIAMYHHNNDFIPDTLLKLTRKTFELHQGKTTMIWKQKPDQNESSHVNTRLQHLANLSTVMKALGMTVDEFETTKEFRKKITQKLIPGLVHSHIQPFIQNGNGPTLIENAFENRIRGAKPMTEDEIQRINKTNEPRYNID